MAECASKFYALADGGCCAAPHRRQPYAYINIIEGVWPEVRFVRAKRDFVLFTGRGTFVRVLRGVQVVRWEIKDIVRYGLFKDACAHVLMKFRHSDAVKQKHVRSMYGRAAAKKGADQSPFGRDLTCV